MLTWLCDDSIIIYEYVFKIYIQLEKYSLATKILPCATIQWHKKTDSCMQPFTFHIYALYYNLSNYPLHAVVLAQPARPMV